MATRTAPRSASKPEHCSVPIGLPWQCDAEAVPRTQRRKFEMDMAITEARAEAAPARGATSAVPAPTQFAFFLAGLRIASGLKDNAADARRAMTGNTPVATDVSPALYDVEVAFARHAVLATHERVNSRWFTPRQIPRNYSGSVISGKACIIARQASEYDNGSSQPMTKDVAAVNQVLDRFVQIRESALRVGAWTAESANGACE